MLVGVYEEVVVMKNKLWWVFRDNPGWYGCVATRTYQRTANGVPVKVEWDDEQETWWFAFKSYEQWLKAEGR